MKSGGLFFHDNLSYLNLGNEQESLAAGKLQGINFNCKDLFNKHYNYINVNILYFNKFDKALHYLTLDSFFVYQSKSRSLFVRFIYNIRSN